MHAAGGFDMLKAAVAASGDGLSVLAVTVLTSLDDIELQRLGMKGSITDAVLRLAERALDAGAPGLVCSPLEVAGLRAAFGPRSEGGPLLVTPGIRPDRATGGDQRRVASPRAALDAGADLLVIGRPITTSPDPSAAIARIRADLQP